MVKHFFIRAGSITLLFLAIIAWSNRIAERDVAEGGFPVRGAELFFLLTLLLILGGGILLLIEARMLRRKNMGPLSMINLVLAAALALGLIIFLPYFMYFL